MAADVVKFEEFELDLRGYHLQRSGRSLKLERIPMQLLVLLIERRGELEKQQPPQPQARRPQLVSRLSAGGARRRAHGVAGDTSGLRRGGGWHLRRDGAVVLAELPPGDHGGRRHAHAAPVPAPIRRRPRTTRR